MVVILNGIVEKKCKVEFLDVVQQGVEWLIFVVFCFIVFLMLNGGISLLFENIFSVSWLFDILLI